MYKATVITILSIIFAVPVQARSVSEVEADIMLLTKKSFVSWHDMLNLMQKRKDDNVLIEDAQDSVRENLRDPDSAKFKDVELFRKNGLMYVCGEVNAKNAYGGYTGFKKFIGTWSSTNFYDDTTGIG